MISGKEKIMLINLLDLRKILELCVLGEENRGKEISGLMEELKNTEDSYDAFDVFSKKLAALPLRKDWPYVEPDDFEAIKKEWDKGAEMESRPVDDAGGRVKEAFLSRVCGCMLGKPVEFNPTLDELKKAGEKTGEWPLSDYISDKFLDAVGRHNECRYVTAREKIKYAVPDDDLNYTVLGMLILEKYGKGFLKENQRDMWLSMLAPGLTYGPERNIMAKASLSGIEIWGFEKENPDFEDWRTRLNPGNELCGAMIRVDAYGYACAGNPALAAELAYKDASFTHVKTGVYSSMYIAAAIALAAVEKNLFTVMKRALEYVPQKSRFAEITRDCLEIVEKAGSWMDAYSEINKKYGEYTHCAIYQETGELINSLHFSKNPHEAFCLQVMQGNDTDSFGATAGSIAGMFYGKGSLDKKWLKPFNNIIHTSLADFHEQDLNALAGRISKLPERVK